MSLLPRVVLAALELEDNDLFAETVFHDFAGDLGARDRGHAGTDRVAIGAEEDVVEFDGRAGFTEQRGNTETLAWLGTELLAASADDRVAHGMTAQHDRP